MVEDSEKSDFVYRCLVVDSGPIIRRTALTSLWKKAESFYTVPAVLQEIKDAKAREHLDSLPFDLVTRQPSQEGIHAVVEFARLTGDYQSLSSVDLQVLGLLYDLEKEGCDNSMTHVRKTPKRMVGVGKIEPLGNDVTAKSHDDEEEKEVDEEEEEESESDQEETSEACSDDLKHRGAENEAEEPNEWLENNAGPKTWAMLVNPQQASLRAPTKAVSPIPSLVSQAINVPFGKMQLGKIKDVTDGQFGDAEDDNALPEIDKTSEGADNNRIGQADKFAGKQSLEEDLESEFPALAAASLVPYEEEAGKSFSTDLEALRKAEEERRKKSLQPVSNSGKLYNSLRGYRDLLKPKTVKNEPKKSEEHDDETPTYDKVEEDNAVNKLESRIIGGTSLAGQDGDVEDDGEGWITSTTDLKAMKMAGIVDPQQNPGNLARMRGQQNQGPLISQRAACATTDFAMQNVILQMNLELLSVDGFKVRKLKSWVTRCGACYKVYTNTDNAGPISSKRLFCERCGSDFMQRIAASVDGKTGRVRLHLSKKYKHNLRGTKFSLPKPGSGNRFQGDLLLREDQLMTGAWNQKLKMSSGGRARDSAQSMFGRDIATNVGCHANSTVGSDIRVGFGRRNPNAAKGRERRGKKKKSKDKACGLRRY